MKSLRILALVSFITLANTTSVFASWWNPFTWGIFQSKPVSLVQVAPAPNPVVQNVQVVSSTTEVSMTIEENKKLPVAENILIDRSKNLTNYEKGLVQKYIKKSGRFDMSVGIDALLEDPEIGVALKFYNENVVFFEDFDGKGSVYFNFYTIDTLEKINKEGFINNINNFGTIIENSNYIIIPSEDNLIFYKKGAPGFQVVPNSLLVSKKETYLVGYDMGGDWGDLTFDESTRVLTSSVFKRPDNRNPSVANKKIRTVKFVLP
jgi:hypothetical protein